MKDNFNIKNLKTIIFPIICIICAVYLQFLQIQFSIRDYLAYFFDLKFLFLLLNLAAVFALDLLFFIITRRWSVALCFSCVICAIMGIGNYHVTAYHGYPLFPSVMANAGAAMNVMSGYRPIIDARFWIILLITLAQFCLIRILRVWEKKNKNNNKNDISRSIRVWTPPVALLCDILIIGAIVFSFHSALVSSSTGEAICQYGFPACFLDDLKYTLYPCQAPEGYTPEALADLLDSSSMTDNINNNNLYNLDSNLNNKLDNNNLIEKPDIIIILNETFCDLSIYADLKPDNQDYMRKFYNIPGAVYGHAITPGIGGGTNNAEFELLTGNSMILLKRTSPFQYLNFQKVGVNLAQYLGKLGYISAAMHDRDGHNYARGKAYPAMGFDTVLLGPENFPDVGSNGNRMALDTRDYDYLIRQYENMPSDAPRFVYLLTYQNHGGWEQNPDDFDTVHTGDDFGEFTDDINEYMSTVKLSCDAFRGLIDYFSQSNRPVIVFMTGDHAPSFISDLPGKSAFSNLEERIVKRTTPYVIYNNYGADFSDIFSGTYQYASMFMFAPEIIKLAGLPLTDYYQDILNMRSAFPVLTSDSICMNADGDLNLYSADNNLNNNNLIKKYLYLEYNGLTSGDDENYKFYYLP